MCTECCNGTGDGDDKPFYIYFKNPPFDGGTLVCNPQPEIPCTWFGSYSSGGWKVEFEVVCSEGSLVFNYDEYQWVNGQWVHATGPGNHGFFSGADGPVNCDTIDFNHSLVIGGVVVGIRIQGKTSHDASGQ